MSFQWHRQPSGDEEGQAGSSDAVVRWVVAGPLTTKEALADANLPIARNDPHPDYGAASALRCETRRIVANGFRVMQLEASFAVPSNGTSFESEEPSLLNPIVFSWSTIQESPQIQRDRDNKVIVTSARRRVSGITRTLNYKRLSVTRWESSYDNTQAQAIENHVNSTTFLGGTAGTVKCSIVQPNASYDELAALIPIEYTFDFKTVSIWGEQPWQPQNVDEDYMAYASIDSSAVLVRLVDKGGNALGPQLLDGKGRPLDSTVTYSDPATGDPVESPTWSDQGVPNGAEIVAAGDAIMLRWYTLPESDFNSLGLN